MGNFFKSLFSSTKGSDFDIFKYDGVRAQRMGKLAYAIKCFEEALAIQDDFETMTMLASAYLANHQTEEALEVANRMVGIAPENVEAYMARVNVLFIMDKEQDVIADCKKILELDGENFAARFLMAKAKRTIKEYDGAIGDLTKAVGLKEDFAAAWSLRAEVLYETGKPAEALPDIEKAISLETEEESFYLIRGKIHEALNDLDAATADFNEALGLNPFNEEASLLSASLLIRQGKADDAIAILDEILELKPDSLKALMERAKAKALKGDKEGAATDLAAAKGQGAGDKEQGDTDAVDFNKMYEGGIF